MEKYGLIGYPLGHSFSISYFNQKFQDEGIDAVYENLRFPQSMRSQRFSILTPTYVV